MSRIVLMALSLLLTASSGWCASIYTYTIEFGASEETAQTRVQFLSLTPIQGVIQPALNITTLVTPPYPGAVLRYDIDPITLSTTGAVVVTVGPAPGSTDTEVYQFYGLFPALTGTGVYPFSQAFAVKVNTDTRDQIAIGAGFVSMSEQQISGGSETPEPTTASLLGAGIALLAGGAGWNRRRRKQVSV